jgi:hypothetical protein
LQLPFFPLSHFGWLAQCSRGTNGDTGTAIPANLLIYRLVEVDDNLGIEAAIGDVENIMLYYFTAHAHALAAQDTFGQITLNIGADILDRIETFSYLESGQTYFQVGGNPAQFTYVGFVTYRTGTAVVSQQQLDYYPARC